MTSTFNDLYRDTLKQVFLERAQQQLEQGADSFACADAYAGQGKPDFVLAHLLLSEDVSDDVKRDLLAQAYERRAILSEEKAEEFSRRFQRPFPLVKLEAQKDRQNAQRIRQGRRIRKSTKNIALGG